MAEHDGFALTLWEPSDGGHDGVARDHAILEARRRRFVRRRRQGPAPEDVDRQVRSHSDHPRPGRDRVQEVPVQPGSEYGLRRDVLGLARAEVARRRPGGHGREVRVHRFEVAARTHLTIQDD